MVVGNDGVDARPVICARTADLYLDLPPSSRGDAGRLYARACQLGDSASCSRAKTLGVDVEQRPAAVAKPAAEPSPGPIVPGPKPFSSAQAALAGLTNRARRYKTRRSGRFFCPQNNQASESKGARFD